MRHFKGVATIISVRKRNGDVVDFNADKIKQAILKCGCTDMQIIDSIINSIVKCNQDIISVSDIQHYVENGLMDNKCFDNARDYISYRYLHDVARDKYNKLSEVIKDKLFANSVENQNANIDERSFGGRKGEMANAILKQFALDNCMSKMARANHLNNEIYIHDLDSYALGLHNCLSIPFDDLLANGFITRQTDVRPAQSVSTALQLVAVIFQIQSLSQFGGASATHLDWTLVPYVRKSFNKHYRIGLRYLVKSVPCDDFKHLQDESIDCDRYKAYDDVYNYALDMTIREIYQAVEGMYHNLNTLQSRSGNQLPFTSINYGTCTLHEGRLIIKALLDTSIKGIGKLHRTSVFPCGIFQIADGINKHKGEPNYDLFRLALKSTAKRLYPNYVNVDWSVNANYDKDDYKTYTSTMGCRTYNGHDINGFGQLKDGRGNICPVTIILPTLAMQVVTANEGVPKDDVINKFISLLDLKIHEAKDMLIERFNYICSQSPDSAKFMWDNNTMAGYVPSEGIRSAMKHGTLALGQLGLAETLNILIGKDQTTDEGMQLAKRIEQLFYDRCKQFKNKYKLNIGVYYTPAENLCYTAMCKFKEKYGEIPNVSDKLYFTNSVHVPVWDKIDIFEKIDIESQLTGYSNSGCITYGELDSDIIHNIDALEKIVIYAMDKDIPYFAINVPNDACNSCGYCGEINDICPQCGSGDIKRLRRVTGYLTSDYRSAFNLGKQQEVDMRIKHTGVRMD